MFEVRLDGLNSARKTEIIARHKIRLYTVRTGKALTFKIRDRDSDKIKGLFADASVVPVGWSATIRLWATKCVAVGVLIAVLLTAAFGAFTFDTVVTGADRYAAELEEYLCSVGLSELRFKGDLNTDKIASDLMHAFPFSLVSVKVEGCYLHVSVKEELPPSHVEGVQANTAIVASHSGVVTRMVVTSGRTMASA